MKKTISKIKLTKEQQQEVDHLLKGEPVKKTKLVKNSMRNYSYEYTSNRPISKDMIKKRLCEIYGGICTACGYVWPDFKVSYDYFDERQSAARIERYCSECWKKWKDKL